MIQYNIVLIQVFQKGCPSITTFLVQAVLKLQTRRTVKSSPRCLNNIGGSGQSFGLIAHSSCVQQKFNEQVILYSNADFIAPRASGPLVLVWSSHLASCWLCAHRTVTARMSRLTLHACLARYSQKPKFNSIIWGWEAVTVKPNNCNPSYFYETVLMAALQVIVEYQMKLWTYWVVMIRLKLSQTEMNDQIN